MAARKRAAKSRSNTTASAPPKRNFSGILPNLPIQFSGRLLANAKPQSLAERQVVLRLATLPMVAIGLDPGVKAGQSLGGSVSSFVSSEQRLLDFSIGTGLSTPRVH